MSGLRCEFVWDAGTVGERLSGRAEAARAALAEAVLTSAAAYVPQASGTLLSSGHVENGCVVYDAPYARAVYYGYGGNGRNPLASAQWIEKARASHASDWLDIAQAAFGDR